ncbi:MAG: PAS domain S-box protein [Actinobacteria bacterium]|nr:MAG: PAS domain S-box protein [Actinomycetota bacterium]
MANILLVDDRAENLLALEAILEPLGQNLLFAHSGEDALRKLLQHEVALILLDVQMPVLDGFGTAALIKQRERTKHIPIIFVTAISKDEEHVFRGYSSGAVDYIFKPFSPEVMRSKVSVFIELHEKNEQLRRQAEQLKEQELAELRRESEERYRFLAEAQPDQIWTALPSGELDYVNQRALDYLGTSFSESVEAGWTHVMHPDDLPRTIELWQRALDTAQPYENELRLRRADDGSYRWHLTRAVPMRSRNGEVVKWFGSNTDIHDRKRAEEAQQFLVEAGAVLGSSLDYRNTLAALAKLAVPRIADWARVDISEDGRLRTLAVEHVDPKKVELALELARRYPEAPDAGQGPPLVLRTGQSELAPEITEDALSELAVDDLHFELVRELGFQSYMCVPLVARGRTLGVISFVAAESGRRYGDDDLALAEELARRAGTAVENAQLYREAEERAQAARVLETVGDGVFLVDLAGIVRIWNRAAEAITGLSRSGVVGRPAAEVLPGWHDLTADVPVAGAPGPAAAVTLPVELAGDERWLSISGVGFDEGTVYAFRDLTEERALEQIRKDLVATVSHELRTPLAAIYGSALTLAREDLQLEDAMESKLLEVIVEESSRLAEIVNELLVASQLDAGRLDVHIEHCDPRSLAESVLDAARTHLPEGITVELEPGENDLPPVAADEGQLRQVLGNVIDNAVKYSPDGGDVRVRLERLEDVVRFVIADHGLGIPPAEQDRIFEKFYRLDPDMVRGIGGTGLGLYISRELVRRVNGRIWVEPNEVRGSIFFVEIPAASEPAVGKNPRKRARASA